MIRTEWVSWSESVLATVSASASVFHSESVFQSV